MQQKKLQFPAIGMRIVKSSVAVFLCYMVYLLRGETGVVFYSQLAALWCIQPYVNSSLKNALQRTVGTFIGAAFGLIVIPLFFYLFHGKYHFLQYLIISLMIIPVIYVTVFFHRKDASFFSCVVFLSIVVLHVEDGNPFFFVWERFSDTMIGILIGILVNLFHLPHKKRYDLLFLSGLDETLLNGSEKLSNFSIIELNQMLEDGLNFTISTQRTPASLIEPLKQIHLNLPVIAMDGAVLYDINTRKYLKSYVISYQTTKKITDFIHKHGFQCFINVIVEDTLMIYHQALQNDAEKEIFHKMYSSPYRNYLSMELPENTPCIYIMMIDTTKRINQFYAALEKAGYEKELKILHYASEDYPGYSYIKIYNRNAKKENMIDYLRSKLQCSRTITFGSIEGRYDYIIHMDEPDTVVHLIKKLFEPIGFPWNSVGEKRKKEDKLF